MKDPSQFDSFRREQCGQKHDDKCIDIIYGIKAGKSAVQALRYKTDIWTESAARSHCKDRGGTFEAAAKDDENMGRGYNIKAAGPKVAQINIYEEVGAEWDNGLTAKQLAKDLKDFGAISLIKLSINSPGGSVFEGNAIYNILKQHAARVESEIIGFAVSIASVIAMAGDKIAMAENALMMIHDAWALAVGNATELRRQADMLDKVNDSLRVAYRRTGLADDAIKQMMADETWMNADEAKNMGFVDEVTPAIQAAAHFDLSKFKYRRAPALPDNRARRDKLAHMNVVSLRIRGACAK